MIGPWFRDPPDPPDLYLCSYCGDEHYQGEDCPVIVAEDAHIAGLDDDQ